jgi:hypothetical protein
MQGNPMEFKVKNTELLLKYLNCVERVFFIDNKLMKDYDDLKNGVKKEYHAASKFLEIILDYCDNNNLSILRDSLPSKDDLKTQTKPIKFVVLDVVSQSSFISDEEVLKNYVVVGCPEIEKTFHFKVDSINEKDFLTKGIIKDFDFHSSLPRIKIYSKDIEKIQEKAKLDELKFIYTLPDDAQIQTSSLKIHKAKAMWDELVADPSYGVQIGNLGLYFISPIKIKEIKTNSENLHQIILLVEDWKKKEFEFSITSELYKNLFGEFPKIGIVDEDFFIRSLTFQGYEEDFRHILYAEKISEKQFSKDSIFSFVRFRKRVSKELLNKTQFEDVDGITEYNNEIYYLPKGYSPHIFDSKNVLKNKDWDSIGNLRKYNEFKLICNFHQDWLSIYENNENILDMYNSLRVIEPPTYGIHKSLLKNLLFKFTFYARNKELFLFCLNCEKYLEYKKTKDILSKCPLCGTKVIVALDDKSDYEALKYDKSLIDKYNKRATIFIKYSKFLYYTMNFTKYSINTCVKILNEINNLFDNENSFFEKLFEIKKRYDGSHSLLTVLYNINKENEDLD